MNKILVLLFIFIQLNLNAQSIIKQFKMLSSPEKCWVIKHPFVAKKALKISNQTRSYVAELKDDTLLDADGNGGQLDAFRHCLWTALLTKEINPKRAKKLGDAHEKGNYKDFLKKRNEDGTIPDKASSQMDYLNNDIGIFIGNNYKEIQTDSLIKIIRKELLDGNLWIIKKTKTGQFIDCEGNIIDNSELIGKWENNKCLVKSNFARPD